MENSEKPKPKFVVVGKLQTTANYCKYIVDIENRELYTPEEIYQASTEYFLNNKSRQNQIEEYEAQQLPALKEKIAAQEEYIKRLELQVRYAEHKGIFPDIFASKQDRLDFIKRQMDFDKMQQKSWNNPHTISSANEFGGREKQNNAINKFSKGWK